MRLRIRGPSGSSAVTLDDDATVASLKTLITEKTSLSSFDVKIGYPPKPLLLQQYELNKKVAELDVKLNGEQLIVTSAETTSSANNAGASTSNSSGTALPKNKTKEQVSTTTRSKTDSTPSRQIPESAPLSISRKQNQDMSDPPEIFIPEVGGNLVLRIMPDDNSCLFRAISSAVMSDMDAVTELRDVVAHAIQSDPITYNQAVLDNKTPDAYCRWIKSSNSWGGQVELLVLSQHFQIEICSLDVQTLRVDRYNEGCATRCFVVYSGIHYDTIALSLSTSASPDTDVKVFEPPLSDRILHHAIELCRKLQERHYFTDTAAFSIRCHDCNTVVRGENGAMDHAKATGHYNFGEA